MRYTVRAMVFYRRNLPHWHPEGRAIFLTWRLHGTLPEDVLRAVRNLGPKRAGHAFRLADRFLDGATSGPLWLKEPQIADCVVAALRRGEAELLQYTLHAFVVMANHVHVLLTPKIELRRVTNGLKGVTAHDANRILRRKAMPFWQVESFDHWVRSNAQFDRIRAYIENNPVHAGLVARPQDWPWSSAYKK
ncbi:MAG: transposase [Acidobacteria bacterium]|nr:transposase [Acidobacteriota bacterium]